MVSSDPVATVNVKITDFGTSRTFSHGQLEEGSLEFSSTTNVRMTKGVGTFIYCCPEIIRGDTNYSIEKADIYSFGKKN